MEKSILLTQVGLELDCVILFKGENDKCLVYCQNRLIRGIYDIDYVSEIEVVSDWCIIPDCDEFLKEQQNEKDYN